MKYDFWLQEIELVKLWKFQFGCYNSWICKNSILRSNSHEIEVFHLKKGILIDKGSSESFDALALFCALKEAQDIKSSNSKCEYLGAFFLFRKFH